MTHLFDFRILTIFGLVLLQAVVVAPNSASGYELRYAKSGEIALWEESCFHYSIHADGAPGLDFERVREAIRESFDQWEAAPCSYFYFEETPPAPCDKVGYFQDAGNTNLLVWRTESWQVTKEHTPESIALTTLSHDTVTGQIYDADIEFNAEFFDFSLNGEVAHADLRNTATHEIGHTIGLDHSIDADATMYAVAPPGDTVKRDLAEDDLAGICFLYPLEDDPDDCREPKCGLDLDCSTSSCKAPQKGKGNCSVNPTLGHEKTNNCFGVLFAVVEAFVRTAF